MVKYAFNLTLLVKHDRATMIEQKYLEKKTTLPIHTNLWTVDVFASK